MVDHHKCPAVNEEQLSDVLYLLKRLFSLGINTMLRIIGS